MSAEVLRRAAARIQHDLDFDQAHGDPRVLVGVAAWLLEVAERQEPAQRWGRRSHGWTGARHANAVARAYLGSDS